MAFKRSAYKGSCHCSFVQFVVFLDLPHQQEPSDAPRERQRIYRCNCSICRWISWHNAAELTFLNTLESSLITIVGHKLGHFHMRPKTPTEDFYLLSPLDPFKELGDYQCNDRELHFFFCKTCGTTPFIFAGQGQVGELDENRLSELGLSQDNQTSGEETVKAWRPVGERPYCSINGHAIDPYQAGFDMREMQEQKVIQYMDCLSDPHPGEDLSYERPCNNGCY